MVNAPPGVTKIVRTLKNRHGPQASPHQGSKQRYSEMAMLRLSSPIVEILSYVTTRLYTLPMTDSEQHHTCATGVASQVGHKQRGPIAQGPAKLNSMFASISCRSTEVNARNLAASGMSRPESIRISTSLQA